MMKTIEFNLTDEEREEIQQLKIVNVKQIAPKKTVCPFCAMINTRTSLLDVIT